jgi:cell fate regulator YaaT (PSP1 superfamily)
MFLEEGNTQTDAYDWLNDLPDTSGQSDIVEVKFKSTRKEFYRNTENLPLKRGDLIVVATQPGHDLGEVTLTGYLAEKQYLKRVKHPNTESLNQIYRKATAQDLEKLEIARGREKQTLIRSRQIAADLKLDMKIGDVEFRGDNNKAIFYYIAENRVDFRELIKLYAKEFAIKIEMKQIGARQEAGLVGGIGSCGRELCCSSWRNSFNSISADAALRQGLSPSAQKMAGACGKLKCCLMYELDVYLEAGKDFPRELLNIETTKGIAKPFKTDYLMKEIWYIYENGSHASPFKLSVKEVKEIIQNNKRGQKPEIKSVVTETVNEENHVVKLEERIDRFDKNRRNTRRMKNTAKANRRFGVLTQNQKPNLN